MENNKKIKEKNKIKNKKYLFVFFSILFLDVLFVFVIVFRNKVTLMFYNKNNNFNKNKIKHLNINHIFTKFEEIFNKYYDNNSNFTKADNDPECNQLDPINMINNTLNNKPNILCQNDLSYHICYKNTFYDMNEKNGIICKMKNIIIDPSKWNDSGLTYNGPAVIGSTKKTSPILSKGFFNIKCTNKNKIEGEVNWLYKTYLNSWNYEYEKDKENIEELASGKTIFFISRNEDSPNIYHGFSEFINALTIMYLLNLTPEKVKIVFLESLHINNDPLYEMYQNIISRGGEIIYIRNLKKKYLIKSAVHIPFNLDSPCFLKHSVPKCKFTTQTYKLLNIIIDKYMNISEFVDSFITDNISFYYPNSTIYNYKSGNKFNKFVTILWRKPWPDGRRGQGRIFANGPEIAEKLSNVLPNNILIRLVDNARLNITQQIALMKKTDYLTGIHGCAFTFSIFAPRHCIIHEISSINHVLMQIESLSGHKFYSDNVVNNIKIINDNENIFYDANDFVRTIINHMKENNF